MEKRGIVMKKVLSTLLVIMLFAGITLPTAEAALKQSKIISCKATAVAEMINRATGSNYKESDFYADSSGKCKSIQDMKFGNFTGEYKIDNSGTSKEAQLQKINDSLNRGVPIVVQVSPGTPHHWVTILSKSGDTYWIADPADGKEKALNSQYTLGAHNDYGYVSLNNSSHVHNFISGHYEAVHPHRNYAQCSCGVTQYTSGTTLISSCSQCMHTHNYISGHYEAVHPHRNYAQCSCGATKYVDGTSYMSSCSLCKAASSKPTDIKLTTNKSTYTLGETVTFTASARGQDCFTISVLDEAGNTVFSNYTGFGSTISFVPTKIGKYSAHVSAINAAGYADSEKIYFTVTNPAAKPTDVTISTNKSTYNFGEKITFTINSKGADYYTITVRDASNNIVFSHRQGTDSPDTLLNPGTYSAQGTATNSAGSTDSGKVYFTVLDEKTYIVSFIANGGSLSTQKITVTRGNPYGELPTPTRNGYRFLGWYTSYGGKVTSSSIVTTESDHTLYAEWEKTNSTSGLPLAKLYIYDNRFADVTSGSWYYNNVVAAYEMGLFQGASNTAFNTTGNVSVAEAITLAARIHQIYHTGSDEFEPTSIWYQTYVDYAQHNSITNKLYSNYNSAITRAEFAQILANALPDEAFEQINTVDDGAIPDVNASSAYAIAIYKLYRAGILSGNDTIGTFNPSSSIIRVESAAIVTRLTSPNLRITLNLYL